MAVTNAPPYPTALALQPTTHPPTVRDVPGLSPYTSHEGKTLKFLAQD